MKAYPGHVEPEFKEIRKAIQHAFHVLNSVQTAKTGLSSQCIGPKKSNLVYHYTGLRCCQKLSELFKVFE